MKWEKKTKIKKQKWQLRKLTVFRNNSLGEDKYFKNKTLNRLLMQYHFFVFQSHFPIYLGTIQIHIYLLCPVYMLYCKIFATGFEHIDDIISSLGDT